MSETKKTNEGVTPSATQNRSRSSQRNFKAKALWVCMIFVLTSIGFSSYMVYFGGDTLASKVMIAPQVIFAVTVVFYKFVIAK